jgi:hypothetical protein
MLAFTAEKSLGGNFRDLLFETGLLSDEAPGVTVQMAEAFVGDLLSWFTIEVNGVKHETKVESGKFKSALLLYHLANLAGSDSFIRCEADRKLIEAYFGLELVHDALTNPETKHTTIRDLLVTGSVRITINRSEVA